MRTPCPCEFHFRHPVKTQRHQHIALQEIGRRFIRLLGDHLLPFGRIRKDIGLHTQHGSRPCGVIRRWEPLGGPSHPRRALLLVPRLQITLTGPVIALIAQVDLRRVPGQPEERLSCLFVLAHLVESKAGSPARLVRVVASGIPGGEPQEHLARLPMSAQPLIGHGRVPEGLGGTRQRRIEPCEAQEAFRCLLCPSTLDGALRQPE